METYRGYPVFNFSDPVFASSLKKNGAGAVSCDVATGNKLQVGQKVAIPYFGKYIIAQVVGRQYYIVEKIYFMTFLRKDSFYPHREITSFVREFIPNAMLYEKDPWQEDDENNEDDE